MLLNQSSLFRRVQTSANPPHTKQRTTPLPASVYGFVLSIQTRGQATQYTLILAPPSSSACNLIDYKRGVHSALFDQQQYCFTKDCCDYSSVCRSIGDSLRVSVFDEEVASIGYGTFVAVRDVTIKYSESGDVVWFNASRVDVVNSGPSSPGPTHVVGPLPTAGADVEEGALVKTRFCSGGDPNDPIVLNSVTMAFKMNNYSGSMEPTIRLSWTTTDDFGVETTLYHRDMGVLLSDVRTPEWWFESNRIRTLFESTDVTIVGHMGFSNENGERSGYVKTVAVLLGRPEDGYDAELFFLREKKKGAW